MRADGRELEWALVSGLVLALALSLGCATLAAQSAPPAPRLQAGSETVPANTAFRIGADATPANTTEYRLVLNAAVVQTKPVTALANGVIEFSVTGHPAGTYTYLVRAANATATTDSGPLALTVTSPDPLPTLKYPAQVITSTPFTTTWTAPAGSSATDWIGIFLPGKPDDVGWTYTQGAPTGSWTATAPAVAGGYEMRYCLNDGYSCPFVGPLKVIASAPPVDCVPSAWSEWVVVVDWHPINATTEERTLERTRTVVTPPQNGGATCDPLTETKTETRPITNAVTGTVEMMTCTWLLTATPPTQTSGWTAQFKRGTTVTTNIGSPDKSAPYQKTTALEPGTYAFAVTWTKSGTSAVTQSMGSHTCAMP